MSYVTLDSESVGLFGLPVILQYAYDNEPVQIHDIWEEPLHSTLTLIESFCEADYVQMFNATFDWFMLCKLYTTFSSYHNLNAIPEDIIYDLAILEEQARFKDICVKPKGALDLMLVARKTRYQSLMERRDVKIRRVPTPLAYRLANHLERGLKLDDIYFARRKDKHAPRWVVEDCKKNNDIDPNFKDLVLRFKASGGLKSLVHFALGKKVINYKDIEVPRSFWPDEVGWAPYALALATKYNDGTINWGRTWPNVISEHILHWRSHARARKYAADDVVYTRELAAHLGNPEPNDTDSNLACMVAAARWRGYSINIPKLEALKAKSESLLTRTPTAPKVARIYLEQKMDEIEKMCLIDRGTKRIVLEEIEKWKDDEGNKHPAAVRAEEILEARKAKKKIELYDKLIKAKRFHASFRVIGTLSNRMSGADGLNAHGIDRTKEVRACFTFADYDCGEELDGGDFKSYEVSIAAAVFDDKGLTETLLSGKKIHALFGMEMYPGETYEQILASEGTTEDHYGKGKNGVFTIFYGGDENTLKNKYGIPIEVGQAAFQRFIAKYPNVGKERQKTADDFCSMRQPGGIGTRVEWHEPADYVESIFGFRRYFTLENSICKFLFGLAQNPPEEFKYIKIKVIRRERIQTACGASQSALYAAAFNIQSSSMRAANNHKIQSPGATIAKETQKNIWKIQPSGIGPWLVRPMNVHDEIENAHKPQVRGLVKQAVNDTIALYKKRIPLLAIDWVENIPNWAGKKG